MRSPVTQIAEEPAAETLHLLVLASTLADTSSAAHPTPEYPATRVSSPAEKVGEHPASSRTGVGGALSRALTVSELRVVIGWTLIAFLLRLLLLSSVEQVISPDGVDYVQLSQRLSGGFFRAGINAWTPPLYPIQIWLMSAFVGDGELAGRLVSVFGGSVLVVPVYFLIHRAYGQRTATCGAVLTALHPLLIYYSTQVLTEATYTLVFFFAVLAGWWAISTWRTRWFALTGLALGACYLVKAEAFGFILLMLVLTLASGLARKTVSKKSLFFNCLALVMGFLVLAAPYLIHLRLQNGGWTISGKLQSHMWQGSRNIAETARGPVINPVFPGVWVMLTQLAKALRYEFELFNLIFPPTFVLIAGLGLFRTRWNRIRASRELYLFSFVAAALAGYAVTLPNIRFLVPLLPILLFWVAKGVVEFEEWVVETLARIKGARRFLPGVSRLIVPLVIAALLVSLLPLFVYLLRGDKWGDYHGQKSAAMWIKEQEAGAAAPVIMSTVPVAAFYAEGRHVLLVDETPAQLVARARREKVSYVIINERNLKHMSLRSLLDEKNQLPGIQLVHSVAEYPGHKILVYALTNAELAPRQ